jgi:hypothetical protein
VDWGGAAQTIVFGDNAGRIVAVDGASGATRTGWPVTVDGSVTSDPAVWDLDFDGVPEVILGTGGGMLHAFHPDGSEASGWPKSYGGSISFGPAIGNVTGTPAFELVFAAQAPQQLHVVDRTGVEVPGWPVAKKIATAPVIADLDHDGVGEIVVGALDSSLTVYWPP